MFSLIVFTKMLIFGAWFPILQMYIALKDFGWNRMHSGENTAMIYHSDCIVILHIGALITDI